MAICHFPSVKCFECAYLFDDCEGNADEMYDDEGEFKGVYKDIYGDTEEKETSQA